MAEKNWEIGRDESVCNEITMNKCPFLFIAVLYIGLLLSITAAGQTKGQLGIVCGDPTAGCRSRENFQPYELPFETGKNFVIVRSQLFYAVILKSVKLNASQGNCEKAIPESDRAEAQVLFPRNMVFVMRCWESGQNSYTNVADGVSFMAVYVGQSLSQANAFLKKVTATGKFSGATMRRMRAEINGT
jgi:hypothetical protein